MRVIFLGSGVFATPTLRWLAQSEHEVPLVVTQPARGAGRGRHVTRTPVAAIATELGLEVLAVENVNDAATVARLRDTGSHLGLVIAFGQKLGNELLPALPGGFVNLHASLLPKYRGAAPINWAILRGEQRTGCTVFRIVEKMDAGPILSSRWTEIKPEETAGELHDRLAGIGVDAVRAAFERFDGGAIPDGEPQNHAEATTAPKLKKTDGVIDWTLPAEAAVNHILGMTPWPGATTRFSSQDGRWENVTILRARIAEDPASLLPIVPRPSRSGQPEPQASACATGDSASRADAATRSMPAPGTIDARRYVATARGVVEILEIKPTSGRTMTWPEYVNGRHVAEGDRFE